MATSPETPESIMAQAKALVDKVQRDLAEGEAFLRSQGLDPENFHANMQSQLTDQGRKLAEEAFRADMASVDEAVREETARLSSANAKPGPVRRRRPMI